MNKLYIIIVFCIVFLTGCGKISCPENTENIDNKCYKSEYQEPGEDLLCPYDYVLTNDICEKEIKEKAQSTETCPTGYESDNNTCFKNEYINLTGTYACVESNSILIKNRCYNLSNMKVRRYYYMCGKNSKLTGGYCNFVRTTSIGVNIYACPAQSPNYQCSLGYLTWEATYYYGCDNSGMAGSEIEFLSMCHDYNKSTSSVINYSCPLGYNRTSDKMACFKTVYANSKKTYFCEEGKILIENECVSIEEENPRIVKTCSSGYKLENNKCILKTQV